MERTAHPAILIADDHPICITALSIAARQASDAAVICQAGTIAESVALAEQTRFDLVLLDLMLPDAQGLSGLLMLRRLQPTAAITIVSGSVQPAPVRQAARQGARGFLSKSAAMSAMTGSIVALLAGGQSFPPELYADDEPADACATALAARIGDLSTAQLRVLQAATGGSQNKQIAYDLGIAETTVKTHLAQIFRKLAVTNRTQAVLALQSLELAR